MNQAATHPIRENMADAALPRHTPRPPPQRKADSTVSSLPGSGAAVSLVGSADATSMTSSGNCQLPVGGGRAAALLARSDPSMLHDVAFYEIVAQELPDSTALQSLLYTQRHVLSTEPTCDELMRAVEDAADRHAKVVAERLREEAQVADEKRRQLEMVESGEREAKLSRIDEVLNRGRLVVSSLKARDTPEAAKEAIKASHESQRQALERRQRERDALSKQLCAELDAAAVTSLVEWDALDHVNARARTSMDEALHRGLCMTEEERDRIHVAFQKANHRQIVAVLEEHADISISLLQQSERELSILLAWVQRMHEQAARQHRLRQLVASMIGHVQSSERADRLVLEREEEVAWQALPPLATAGRAHAHT